MDLEKKVNNKPNFFKRIAGKAMPYVFAAGLGLAVFGCRHEPTPPTPEEVITKAADRLVATQNNDGGWEWDNPDTDPNTYPEAYGSYKNTIGVTAQGVLDAYNLTENETYLNSAIDAYNYMTDLVDLDERMRGPDISFLVELSEATGDSAYADLAKDRYIDFYNDQAGAGATGIAQYIRDGRVGQGLPAMAPWDINLYVQGALALDRYFPGDGFDEDAQDMAEVIYNFMYVDDPGFDLSNQTQTEYWLSHTGAIEAFAKTGLHATERDSLLENLLSSQQGDGHFVGVDDGSDVQTTAYSVMSLLKASRRNPTVNAVDYLKNSQLGNGGWNYGAGVENTEITSEAAQAIADYIE